MKALLAALGHPERRVPAIHVGGTNGKGSTCAMLAEILSVAGYRVGRYTSPHLQDPGERICLDGHPMPAPELEALLLGHIAPLAEELAPAHGEATAFELLTAAAFVAFAEGRCDLQVLEVGLGGRLDATNVLDAPLVTAITNVAMDHAEVLGGTLSAIGTEKAGIARPRVPLVTGATGEGLEAIATRARAVEALLVIVPPPAVERVIPDAQCIRVGSRSLELGLLGAHQASNAALALSVLELVGKRGFAVPEEALRQGLSKVRWPGRLEGFRTDGGGVLLDGAHNLAGVAALVAALDAHFPDEPMALVFGALTEKDPAVLLARLVGARRFDPVVLVRVADRRSADPRELASGLPGRPLVSDDWREAMAIARKAAGSRRILVCGSLYLVGSVRSMLASR